LDRNRNNVFE